MKNSLKLRLGVQVKNYGGPDPGLDFYQDPGPKMVYHANGRPNHILRHPLQAWTLRQRFSLEETSSYLKPNEVDYANRNVPHLLIFCIILQQYGGSSHLWNSNPYIKISNEIGHLVVPNKWTKNSPQTWLDPVSLQYVVYLSLVILINRRLQFKVLHVTSRIKNIYDQECQG